MKVGDKFKVDADRQRFTVRATGARFAVMTKPFNAQRTYLYTITDLERGVRGPCDLIFGPPSDLSTQGGAEDALKMLDAGEMGVSRRRCVALTEGETSRLSQANAA